MSPVSEQWRPFTGRDQLLISSLGRVKSVRTGKFLLGSTNGKGYHYIKGVRTATGRRAPSYIHVAVLTAFRGPRPLRYDSAHLDGNRGHNVLDNLQWVERRENYHHQVLHGTVARGQRHGHAVLTENEARNIIARKRLGAKPSAVAKMYPHTKKGTITSLMAGVSWKWLWEEICKSNQQTKG